MMWKHFLSRLSSSVSIPHSIHVPTLCISTSRTNSHDYFQLYLLSYPSSTSRLHLPLAAFFATSLSRHFALSKSERAKCPFKNSGFYFFIVFPRRCMSWICFYVSNHMSEQRHSIIYGNRCKTAVTSSSWSKCAYVCRRYSERVFFSPHEINIFKLAWILTHMMKFKVN